ncbi:MAG TPA: PaaI family thioesterase [Acidiferrobacterales bacterium]|nr:PaaI family thioesterase [Acidiferrobacterales bacterium]
MQDTSEAIRIQWLEQENAMRTRLAEPGVVPPAGLAQHSGLEFLKGICSGELPLPPISKVLDFFPVEVEPGRVVFQGTPKLAYYNPIGSVHGGWAATLLDSCAGCAIHSMLPAGKGYTTLEFKVNFVRAITSDTGPVRAEGKVISVGNRVGTAEGRLVDSAGRLYAHATTTCLIFDLLK